MKHTYSFISLKIFAIDESCRLKTKKLFPYPLAALDKIFAQERSPNLKLLVATMIKCIV